VSQKNWTPYINRRGPFFETSCIQQTNGAISNDFESEIFNDTKHRAACLRQLSFLIFSSASIGTTFRIL